MSTLYDLVSKTKEFGQSKIVNDTNITCFSSVDNTLSLFIGAYDIYKKTRFVITAK